MQKHVLKQISSRHYYYSPTGTLTLVKIRSSILGPGHSMILLVPAQSAMSVSPTRPSCRFAVLIQYWAHQTMNIQKLLGCLSIRAQKILVVKSRNMMSLDPSEAYDILRTCLHQFVPGVQLLHLHYFKCNSEFVNRWLQSFHFISFSFARVVDNFEEGQRESL